ncbi:hypothetical protein CCP3SC15_5340001 [Gammaproteobacteria bacterium]
MLADVMVYNIADASLAGPNAASGTTINFPRQLNPLNIQYMNDTVLAVLG